MSFYKEQLKNWLADKELHTGKLLSIGAMNDDIKYFKNVAFSELKTLDIDEQYKPDYLFDMNNDVIREKSLEKEIRTFDCILALELFEYLWNPIQAFNNFRFLLKRGGSLYLSVPFLYPTHNPTDQDYLRVTEWGIKKILQEAGFEITEFEYRVWKDPSGWNHSVAGDGMRYAKDYQHHNATGFLLKAIKI